MPTAAITATSNLPSTRFLARAPCVQQALGQIHELRMEDFSARVLSKDIVPERRQPELTLIAPTASCSLKHATCCDAARSDLVLRQKVLPQCLRSFFQEIPDRGL